MVSFSTLISGVGAFTAITTGVILSPLPTKIGLYRFVASKYPLLVGLTPAFHHGIEWQYTFEELYDYCPQIKGQTALITGANSGVGFETVKVLAKCGVDVTMACRNPQRCAAAADKIKEQSKDNGYDNKIITMTVDTSSLQSVQKFSKEFLVKNDEKALDMLYLNAGIGSTGGSSADELLLSEDGIELVFATNYVGHHLMYKLLEPLLLKSKLARIVLTSSAASFNAYEHKVATSIEKLNSATNGDRKLYGQSKLAQVIWAKHLTKLLGENSNIYVNACHPGAVDTFIWDKGDMEHMPSFIGKFVNYLRRNAMWTTEEGALTQLFLGVATNKLVIDNIRGKLYHPQAQEVVNPLSLDEQLQGKLWDFSDKLVAKFL